MFDIIYVTWFTHLTTALISAKFWYSLWIVRRLPFPLLTPIPRTEYYLLFCLDPRIRIIQTRPLRPPLHFPLSLCTSQPTHPISRISILEPSKNDGERDCRRTNWDSWNGSRGSGRSYERDFE